MDMLQETFYFVRNGSTNQSLLSYQEVKNTSPQAQIQTTPFDSHCNFPKSVATAVRSMCLYIHVIL